MLLATGSIASPGLAAGAVTAAISFSGTWPGSTTAKTWYVIAAMGAGDDVNNTNNSSASGPVTVSPPNIDDTMASPPGVTNTGATTGGGPLTGAFTVQNIGTANGAAAVSWTAYVSSTSTLGATYQVAATGTTPQLTAGSSTPVTFGGTWPAGTATWHLIVKVFASDDVNNANDTLASPPIVVTGAAPVYAITAVPVPTGATTGQAVSGTLTMKNTALTPGVAAVNWQVYASLGDAVYNAGDVLLASGSIVGGLAAGASSSPAWAGTWPAAAGTYWIVARVSAADAPVVPDAASTPIVVSNPPPPDYFATLGSVTKVSIRALWATGFDDVDLHFWDTSPTDSFSSAGAGIDAEPGGSTWDFTGITAGSYYVSAYAWLANNASGSAGKKYVIIVAGLP